MAFSIFISVIKLSFLYYSFHINSERRLFCFIYVPLWRVAWMWHVKCPDILVYSAVIQREGFKKLFCIKVLQATRTWHQMGPLINWWELLYCLRTAGAVPLQSGRLASPHVTLASPSGTLDSLFGTLDFPFGTLDSLSGTLDSPSGTLDPCLKHWTLFGTLGSPSGTLHFLFGTLDSPFGTLNSMSGTLDSPSGTLDPCLKQ